MATKKTIKPERIPEPPNPSAEPYLYDAKARYSSPFGLSGSSRVLLHFGHGIPGAPQWKDLSSGLSHGLSGCASHTHRPSRQRSHLGTMPPASSIKVHRCFGR